VPSNASKTQSDMASCTLRRVSDGTEANVGICAFTETVLTHNQAVVDLNTEMAVKGGHLEVLKWLRAGGICPWDSTYTCFEGGA